MYCHTTNLVSESDSEDECDKHIISVRCGEEYTLVDIEDDYLQIEGNHKKGWCSLRYCEIVWMDSFKDKVLLPPFFHLELFTAPSNCTF